MRPLTAQAAPLLARAARVVLAAALFLTVGAGPFRASAYRFSLGTPSEGAFLHDDGRETKPRWQAEIWAPGMTATVAVPDHPVWLEIEGIGSMEEARALVDRALAAWNAVGTADIRWRVRHPVEEDEAELTVNIQQLSAGLAGVAGWATRLDPDGVFGAYSCEVTLNEASFPRALHATYGTLVHELGHCLGLGHPARYPSAYAWHDENDRVPNPLWGFDGVMTWGRRRTISFDDKVGASLLRPGPGWLETTGAVYGSVIGEAGLGPVLRVNVLAARIAVDGSLAGPVQTPTNKYGHFVIEGLDPGPYVLMVYTMGKEAQYHETNDDFRETVLLSPVEVRAGERRGPVVLTVRPGGERDWPGGE